jgi:FkbM family methyltransferase
VAREKAVGLRAAATALLRPLARRAGFDIVRWRGSVGRDPFDDLKLFVTKTSPILLDVGGNEGQTVRRLRSAFPGGTIHTFEPGKLAFERLSQACRKDRLVTPWNVGVGATTGKLSLEENSSSVMSSFLPLGRDGWGEIVDRREVDVVRLDDFALENDIEIIDVLKSDTQGYELQVLQGADRLLSSGRVATVLLELIASEIYEGSPRIDEVIGYLLDRNYKIVSIYEQLYQHDILGWTDVLFVYRPS